MSQTLLIRLPAHAATAGDANDIFVEWCLSDGLGELVVQQDSLASVLANAHQHPVVVLVPSDQIVLTEVDLPIKQRAKLVQAVPYALEEHLAEDVDKLHFSVGERQSDGRTPVLAVAHERIQHWLTLFQDAGVSVRTLMPDVLGLPGPSDEQHWSILVEGSQSLVRTGRFSGFACDTEVIPDFLALMENSQAMHLRISATDDYVDALLPALGEVEVEVNRSLRFGLQAMAISASSNLPNLLQGQYGDQSEYSSWWRPFRATAALALLWVLISTGLNAMDYFRHSSEASRLEAENQGLIAELFPEVKTLVPGSERVQLERRLAELQGEGGSGSLFPPLIALAEGFQKTGQLKIQELQLREGTLFVSIIARDIATLERLKSHYAAQATWQLDVESANASSDGVQIRASLRKAS